MVSMVHVKSLFAKSNNAIFENVKIKPASYNTKICLLKRYLAHYIQRKTCEDIIKSIAYFLIFLYFSNFNRKYLNIKIDIPI